MEILIEKAKRGDENALSEITGRYKGLVRSIANRYYLVGGDKDDLLQEGMLGLFNAVRGYDEKKGAFPAFVKMCVMRSIITAVKKNASYKNKPLRDYAELSAAENIVGESSPLDELLEKEYAEKVSGVILQELSKAERQVLELFADGYSYEDISLKLNKSYKAVDGALQRARKKLAAVKE